MDTLTSPTAALRWSIEGPLVTLHLAGELDIAEAQELKAIRESHPEWTVPGRRVEVDLSACTFIGSSGIGQLVVWHRHAVAAGSTLEVVHASSSVQTTVRRLGLAHLLG